MKFVVIGADAAGMSAASRAKRNQPDLDVTVLEMTYDVSYSACGMPYNIADPNRSMEELVVREAEVFRRKQGINLLTGHEVTAIDPVEQRVSGVTTAGEAFQFPYDSLLIATGARPILPDIPGIDLPGVYVLKNLEHGRTIKEYIRIKPVKKVIIIGMGYIALEMCEALCAQGIKVDMVKPNPEFLPWLDRQLAQEVQTEVESKGVTMMAGHPLTRIDRTGERLLAKGDDMVLMGDMILAAIGVTPNSEIAGRAGLALGPGKAVSVDNSLRTSQNNIFAAGDCADAIHVVTGKKVYIPLALRANRAGWAVADNVCGQSITLPGVAGTAVFKVFDLEVARTGLNFKEAQQAGFDPVTVTIKTRSRAHAHPGAGIIWVHMVGDRSSGRLLGAQMVGPEGVAHRINAPAVALLAQMRVDQYVQSDLAYAPPFGPVWDPTLTAANQLAKTPAKK
ncbi:MAG: FAD-dependent oxidoreductase [Desulfobacteraceae bacterium]|jgi:NADPH-dependent 2,4-dienoyl-CoA reductase/sulfur reductase-like enzyme